MASFTPDLDQLHELYRQYGADLFALCYLQAGRPAQALDLMAASLCDMAASPKLWELAASCGWGTSTAWTPPCGGPSAPSGKRIPPARRRPGRCCPSP